MVSQCIHHEGDHGPTGEEVCQETGQAKAECQPLTGDKADDLAGSGCCRFIIAGGSSAVGNRVCRGGHVYSHDASNVTNVRGAPVLRW